MKNLYIKSSQQTIEITEAQAESIFSAKESNPNGQFSIKGSFYDLNDLYIREKEDVDDQTLFYIKGNITDSRGVWNYFLKHFNCQIIFNPEDVSIKNNRYYILSMRQRLELLSFHEKYFLAKAWKENKEVRLREAYWQNPYFMNSDNHIFDTGEYMLGTYGIVVMDRIVYENKMKLEGLIYGEFYT